MILVGTKYCLYSGDTDFDYNIDVSDIVQVYNDVTIGASRYVKTDLTGDDFVDVSDMVIAYNNAINAIEVIAP